MDTGHVCKADVNFEKVLFEIEFSLFYRKLQIRKLSKILMSSSYMMKSFQRVLNDRNETNRFVIFFMSKMLPSLPEIEAMMYTIYH